MKNLPSYSKILTLGSAYTENALVGEVIVQEKIDGSQFRFGISNEGELVIGSKATIIGHPDENKMFKKGVEYILSIEDKIRKFPKNSYFFGEFLQKPNHNVLKYERVPKNNIVLFDAIIDGSYSHRDMLNEYANMFEIDLIPELFKGIINLEQLKQIIENTNSYLCGELVEGVVIKNYKQTILLGGNVFPLFTKYVRESFKERHRVEWKISSRKETIEEYIKSFKNEARWQKAILHLQEKGELEKSPKDIGKLILEIQHDIKTEEEENIKQFLYNRTIGDILRVSVSGVAEYYKDKLLENINKE